VVDFVGMFKKWKTRIKIAAHLAVCLALVAAVFWFRNPYPLIALAVWTFAAETRLLRR
jgi:hypothetical protein